MADSSTRPACVYLWVVSCVYLWVVGHIIKDHNWQQVVFDWSQMIELCILLFLKSNQHSIISIYFLLFSIIIMFSVQSLKTVPCSNLSTIFATGTSTRKVGTYPNCSEWSRNPLPEAFLRYKLALAPNLKEYQMFCISQFWLPWDYEEWNNVCFVQSYLSMAFILVVL